MTGFVKPDSLVAQIVGGLTHPVSGDSGDDTDDMNISDDEQTVIEVCQLIGLHASVTDFSTTTTASDTQQKTDPLFTLELKNSIRNLFIVSSSRNSIIKTASQRTGLSA